MLSRVAESFFWLGRNVERAEGVARILDVTYARAMDLQSPRDGRTDRLWSSVVRCAGFAQPLTREPERAAVECLRYCAFDAANGASIVSSVRVARANALAIRAELTTEVWETINVLYLNAEGQDLRSVLQAGPSLFLRCVRDAAQTFAGIVDATMTRADGWNFLQVGRFLERAYLTARVLEAIDVEHEPWPESQRLLDMCCAGVPFVQSSHRAPEPRDAVEFVVLAADFPRSVRFCIREVEAALHRITGSPSGTFAIPAERRLGRLRAHLDFAPAEEAFAPGVRAFAASLVSSLESLSADVEAAYFPRLPVSA